MLRIRRVLIPIVVLTVIGLILLFQALSSRSPKEAIHSTNNQTQTTTPTTQTEGFMLGEFIIRESSVYEKDFLIEFNNSLIAYISSKFNLGKITDYRKPGSPIDLTGDQAIYPHLILGYLSNGNWYWSDGKSLISSTILVRRGAFVEFEQSFEDKTLGFKSSSIHRFYHTNYLIQKVITTFEATQNISNVVDLYIEFGWDYNDFKYTAIKNKDGQIIVKDMQSLAGVHYFADQKIGRNGWICAYGSSIYNESIALIFDYAKKVNPDGSIEDLPEITPVSWDTNGIYDKTDTIELHVIEAEWGNPLSIQAGTKYILSYYIVVSNGEQSYSWIENVILH